MLRHGFFNVLTVVIDPSAYVPNFTYVLIVATNLAAYKMNAVVSLTDQPVSGLLKLPVLALSLHIKHLPYVQILKPP
jgi:hypothetical protein